MSESTIRPAPISVRKASHDDRDWLYIYLRSNVSEREESDEISGESYVLYSYDEQHLRVPLPEGVEVDVPTDHAENQDALKAQLKALFIDNADFRTALSDALDEAQVVDWRDRVSEWGGETDVAVDTEDNWRYWVVGEYVEKGDQRIYAGTLYECEQPHTTQGDWLPDITPALWTAISEGDEWQSGTSYAEGAVVTHDGDTWESRRANNVWEPGTSDSGWLRTDPYPSDWYYLGGEGYPADWQVHHEGYVWTNTSAGNHWEPGVWGWTQGEAI